MYFSSNIKFLRRRKGRTQDEVSYTLQMKRSTLSGYENEVAQPNLDALVAFSRYYGISIDTMIKIDLTKLSEYYLSQLEKGADAYVTGSKIRVLATTVDSHNEENIEMIPEKATAGYRSGFADPEYIKTLQTFHLPFLSREKKYRSFQICGDSMLPIPDGSWVTGEFVQNWNLIRDRHAYIILTLDDGIVFKVIENKFKTDGTFMLYSFNPIYKPYEVPVKEIKEVWRFVNYISSELPEPNSFNDNLMKTIEALRTDVDHMKKQVVKGKNPGKTGRLFD
jgi:transcriptional regulator with XRE-family HTH domain